MDIQAEKLELIKLLLTTDNPSIIESIKQVFKKEKTTDFWDKLTPDQQLEINQADLEISQSETSNYKTFMSSHR